MKGGRRERKREVGEERGREGDKYRGKMERDIEGNKDRVEREGKKGREGGS